MRDTAGDTHGMIFANTAIKYINILSNPVQNILNPINK